MGLTRVEIAYAGRIERRPPLVEIRANVTLTNGLDERRWFLLPSKIDAAGRWSVGGVSSVAVYGRGACVASFAGTGGFHAVLVAPRATVAIEGLPIDRWGEEPAGVDLDVVVARRLTIGGKPAARWLAPIAVSPDGSSLHYDVMALLREGTTPDGEEQPAHVTGEERIAVHLDPSGAVRP